MAVLAGYQPLRRFARDLRFTQPNDHVQVGKHVAQVGDEAAAIRRNQCDDLVGDTRVTACEQLAVEENSGDSSDVEQAVQIRIRLIERLDVVGSSRCDGLQLLVDRLHSLPRGFQFLVVRHQLLDATGSSSIVVSNSAWIDCSWSNVSRSSRSTCSTVCVFRLSG